MISSLADRKEPKVTEPMTVFPFKPRDWVADSADRVAQVKDVYEGRPGEVLLDLVMYSREGNKDGRLSPAMGGPRTFEPACAADGWERIAEPSFPITSKWVPNDHGSLTMRLWAGARLPPLQWRRPARRGGMVRVPDTRAVEALRAIAAGHNDARALAEKVLTELGKKRP